VQKIVRCQPKVSVALLDILQHMEIRWVGSRCCGCQG